MTIQLNGILPLINNSSTPVNITIGNTGFIPTVTIDGNNGAYSGFFIPMGNVTIQNIIFQNLSAKGGNGGNGISGGGGGMGAGGAIYVPQYFLNGLNPSVTLINVSINNCSAVGGNGGSYINDLTGNEGGGGGGGFSGNGGHITTFGSTGGAGGGGFGGNGGNVSLSTDDILGGGGGGGGGLGSRASIGTLMNLGNGGSDESAGEDGNGYGLAITAGSGAGGYNGGIRAGGGGGGSAIGISSLPGGGGGGSFGGNGVHPQGNMPPGGNTSPSGGYGGDGGGGGGGAIVIPSSSNAIDGHAGSGGYGGGGGGGAGIGSSDTYYTIQGGSGGVGGGGGGGGVNQSGITPAEGGNSFGGGGGGGGPSNGSSAAGGTDIGNLGGGFGGAGANSYGSGFGGGSGGGGSGLGGAIFVDSNLNLTIKALSGIPTIFNTSNNTTQAGTHGIAGPEAQDGIDGSALGNSIFMRAGSSVTLIAENSDDLLTLGDQVSFVDDTSFGGGGTSIFVRGNGTVVYNGTMNYQGTITINNTNFKVNNLIDQASIFVCRNRSIGLQRGMLSGVGTLSGTVYVNSGAISPDAGQTLTLGSLTLNPANPTYSTLGSLVHIEIDSSSTPSVVAVTGAASLAGTLEINIDPNANPGTYTILTSPTLTGTFDLVTFTGATPTYSLSYLTSTNPMCVQFELLGYAPLSPSNLNGKQKRNDIGLEYELYNQLSWTPSPSDTTNGYFIYRDGTKIATVNASTFSYEDHNRKKGLSYSYSITAFDSGNHESSPITLVITP